MPTEVEMVLHHITGQPSVGPDGSTRLKTRPWLLISTTC